MAICVFLCELGAEVAGGGVDVDLALGEAAGKLGVAGLDVMRGIAGNDDDKVGVGRAGKLADLHGGFGKALGEALEVVDELGALFLIEERMIVFALLAAELADVGNAQCDDGQRGIDLQRAERVVGERRAHVGEAGQAQVGLVGAVLAQRFVVSDAREREWAG